MTDLFDVLASHPGNKVLKSYKEDLDAKGIPILGYLVWYFVGEDKLVQQADMIKAILETGAPLALPKQPKLSNIFRRACTDAERLKVPSEVPDEYYNYLVRNSGVDAQSINRVVVQERVDSKNHKLGFVEIGDIAFDKETHKVSSAFSVPMNSLTPEMSDAFLSIVGFVNKYMQDEEFTVTPYVIRETIRHGLLALHASRVREGGGVYFVHHEHDAALMAISAVVDTLPNVMFHYLPLIDDEKQRQMVKEAFVEESLGETHKLMGELSDAINSGKPIGAKKFVELKDRYNGLYEKMVAYQGILEDNLHESQLTLELCNSQLVAIIGGSLKHGK